MYPKVVKETGKLDTDKRNMDTDDQYLKAEYLQLRSKK